MEPNRETTVLFANVIGGANVQVHAADPAAQEALANCLASVRQAAESSGGRVVKTLRDKVMVLVATPDAAADAAAAMHTAMEKLPPLSDGRLSLGVGFHHGPVIQQENDVFGGTVNLASRLAEQAASGHIITTEETGKRLCPLYRQWLRRLYSVSVKGVSGDVELCELLWRMDGTATALARDRRSGTPARLLLRLRYRGREFLRRREDDEITIGRDEGCALVVADQNASRQHCTIERRVDRFVLTDRSANGTYVTVAGEEEVALRREDLMLHKHGWIACGQPRAATAEAVEFHCEES